MSLEFNYIYFWRKRGMRVLDRKDERCAVLARSSYMNSVLIQFESDGHRTVTSRYAVRAIYQRLGVRAVDITQCPAWPIICACQPCNFCGEAEHHSFHAADIFDLPGSPPIDHEFQPMQERAPKVRRYTIK